MVGFSTTTTTTKTTEEPRIYRDSAISGMTCREYVVDMVHQDNGRNVPLVTYLTMRDLVGCRGLGIAVRIESPGQVWITEEVGTIELTDAIEHYDTAYWVL